MELVVKCCVKYSNMSRMVKKQLPVVDGMSFTTEGDNFIVSNSNGSIAINLNNRVVGGRG